MDIGGKSSGGKSAGQWHDALIKAALGRPEHAGSVLRSALPPGIADRIDFDGLEPQPTTFITHGAGQLHSDLLFRTTLDDHPAYVYVLLEHQRTPDRFMALRMLDYQVQIWRRYRAEHPTATLLPTVVPVVVYQGRRQWTSVTDIAELFDVSPQIGAAFGDLLPRARYILDDLTAIDDDTLRARNLTPGARVTFVALGQAPGRDIGTWAFDWLTDFRALESEDGNQLLNLLITYFQRVSDTPSEGIREFAAAVGPRAEEIVVTAVDQIQAETRATTLLAMLERRFGTLTAETYHRVKLAESAQIDRWIDRFVDGAGSPSEVLD